MAGTTKISICAALAAILLMAAGCQVVAPVLKAAAGGKYKKKVVVAGFVNRSGEGGLNLDELLAEPLRERLIVECEAAVITRSPELSELTMSHMGDSLTGLSDTLGLAKRAREHGVNVLVTGVLREVGISQGTVGVIGFRNPADVYTAKVSIWGYDTSTAAKILDEQVEVEVRVEKSQELGVGDNGERPTAEDLFRMLVEKAVAEVCDSVSTTRWTGFVGRVDGDKVLIRSGTDVDVAKDDILHLVQPGEVISGVFGETYQVAGDTVGRLRVIECVDAQCVAEVEKGGPAKAGDWVKGDE
ncbi:MAG: hypothetical protein ACLFOY_05045 [Desulfatibacillaceae bacterium]